MSNLISSQVSVTTGDIAKAAFGAAKQQLAAKIEVLDKDYREKKALLEQKFVDLLTAKLDSLKTNPIVLDMQLCATLLSRHSSEFIYTAVIESDYQSHYSEVGSPEMLDKVFARWFYELTSTGYADKFLVVRSPTPERQNIEFNVSLVAADKNDEPQDETTSIPCLTVKLGGFLKENKELLATIVAIHNKQIELTNRLNGAPSPLTRLTLEEEITNAITMQAVSTLPDIAAVFNTSALAGTVIGGYLE